MTFRQIQSALLAMAWLLPCMVHATSVEGSQAPAGDELALWLTADTEGHVEPCTSCSVDGGRGGLDKRATLIAERRAEQPHALLLDAGNALFGGQSEASGGRVIVAAYNQLGYDVMNVSYRDFRLGKQATRDALAEAEFSVVSANLYDAEHGERLFEPFVVREAGEQRVAIIGLTQRPAALDFLPHLREQLEGITIRPPTETLGEVIAEAQDAADEVVLLYYGSVSGLRDVLDAVEPGQLAAVGVGGIRPRQVPARAPASILASSEHGAAIAHLTLDAEDAPVAAQWHVEPTIEPDPALRETLDAFEPAPDPDEAGVLLRDTLPADLQTGQSVSTVIEGENQGMGIVITEVALLETYGDLRAAPGTALMVVDVEWENRMALDLITEVERPEPILVADVARQMFVLVDDQRVARLHPDSSDQPDALPSGFRLSQVGAMMVGKLVFEVPDPLPGALELRYYHDQYSPLHLPLRPATESTTSDEPVVAAQRNDVMEIAIFDIESHERIGDQVAPSGMRFVSLDVRGRSLVRGETDALALDADAEPGAMAEVGRVLEYLYGIDMIQLLVDGEYAHTMDATLSTLDAEPPMLPDAYAGGRAVFLVPEDVRSLELVCSFPQLKFPTLGDLGVPDTLRLPIEGEPIEPETHEPLATIDDNPTPVDILAAEITEHDDGAHVTFTLRIRNTSDTGGMFNIGSRFEGELGERRGEPEAVTLPHGVPVREPMWLPAGATRGFQLIFAADPDATTARLAYSGVSVARTVQLDLDHMPASDDERAPAPVRAAMADDAPTDESVDEPARSEVDEPEQMRALADAPLEAAPLPEATETPVASGETEQEAEAAAEPEPVDEAPVAPMTFGEAAVEPEPADATEAVTDAEATGVEGDAEMRLIAGDEVADWMRRENRDGVNLALHMLGARLHSDTDIDPGNLVEFHNGRLETRRRLDQGTYRLELAGQGRTTIHRLGFAVNGWPEHLTVTVEAADADGGYAPIAAIGGVEESGFHLRLLEFEPIETDELRFIVEDSRDGTRHRIRLHELMVFEGPLASKAESVLSRGGMSISRLDHGGSAFHAILPGSVGRLLNEPSDGVFSQRLRSDELDSWLAPITLAFQANREALIEAIELWPSRDPDHRGQLPARIRLSASPEEPFAGYETIGEYEVSEVETPWRLELDEPVQARFLRVEFKSREDEHQLRVGELVVREGAEPGYESVMIRGDGIEWRHREQPTLASLMGEAFEQVRMVEPGEASASAHEVEANQWTGATLDGPEQRHVYRFHVDHAHDAQVPELQLHMAPFLRGRVRILDADGEVIDSLDPGQRASTTLRYPLELEPGDYLLEISSAPIYLFMGFDTSGSMGRALPITRDTLPELTDNLPEGVYVALGTSLHDRERGKTFTLQSPYTNNAEALRRAIIEQNMMSTGGGSDWYNFLRDMLEWADENTPSHAVGAKVLVADGVGAGDYPSMWDRLHQSNQRVYTVGWGSQTLRLDHLDSGTGWTAARGLFNVAWYRNGRYFEPQADHELVETYEAILDDVQTPAEYAFRVRVRERQPGRLATVAPAGENRPILFVLDASGSMLIEMDGRTRLDVAFDVMEQVVRNLPEGSEVGLRVYGHRFRAFGDEMSRAATDSELLIPIGPLDPDSFIATVRSINARGATPLAHTIEQIPRDLRRVERPRVIVLTDGVESFRRDPVAKTQQLLEQHPDMDFAVVGFKIGRMIDRENLRGMAEAGDGTYYNAMDAESLVQSLEEAINPVVRYTVYDWEGDEAATGQFGDAHELAEGQYELRARIGHGEATLPIRVAMRRTVRLSLDDLPEPVAIEQGLEEVDPEQAEAAAEAARAAELGSAAEQDADETPAPAASPSFCTQCGERLASEARFCTACGAAVAQ